MVTAMLEMKNITKRFPGVVALDDVDFNLRAGEVHVLIGENGAGKSTLIKILNGVYRVDEGEIYIDGKRVNIASPTEAHALGIGTVYQELSLLPHLSVGENIFLGRLPENRMGLVDRRKLFADSQVIIDKLHIPVKSRDIVEGMSVATQQMIEIAKILTSKAKIIIFDEPTSSLSTREVKDLFELVRLLRSEGVGIIYISHKLDELYEIGDRITVMKDGRKVDTIESFSEKITKNQLINLMVGRKLDSFFNKTTVSIGEETLRVENLCSDKVKNVSLVAHKGEIVGLAGLVGAGRTEVATAIFGADKSASKKVYINKKLVKIDSPHTAIELGIGFITEDRKERGLILEQSVKENITLPSIKAYLSGRLAINAKKENEATSKWVEELGIKTPSNQQLVINLSGGNQQKVVIGKWLSANAKILIMDEPTRGIDIGAKNEVYVLMTELLKKGATILMISSEMQEIMGMSDRIYVMREGRITGELSREEFSEEKIMYYATMGTAD
jgi:ABC-type sugar transport system ATPase subunit